MVLYDHVAFRATDIRDNRFFSPYHRIINQLTRTLIRFEGLLNSLSPGLAYETAPFAVIFHSRSLCLDACNGGVG